MAKLKAALTALTEQEEEAIHEASLQLLQEAGVVFHSTEALSLLQHHGVRVEGKIAYLSPSLVEKALADCPAAFTLKARNPQHCLTIGRGGKQALAPTAGPVYLADSAGRRRPFTAADYINFVKLFHSSELLNLKAGLLSLPADLEPASRYAFIFIASALHTDKPLPALTQNARTAAECLELAQMLYGGPEDNMVLATVNPTTPLVYDQNDLDAMLIYARAHQPLCITSCGMAGSTGPVTLAGTLTVNNAEVLAGIVLVQLLNPGNPVVYGNLSSATDMRQVSFAAGAPEGALLQLAASQMARRYALPFRGGGVLTDAKGIDAQAGYESMMNLMVTMMADYDFVLHAAGVLDSLISVSYEKFIIDEEIGLAVQRLIRGVDMEEDSLPLKLMASLGPGAHYLSTDHTAIHFRRELWQPLISSRQPYTQWEGAGSSGVENRAAQVYQSRLKNYLQPDFCPTIRKNMIKYFRDRYGKSEALQIN